VEGTRILPGAKKTQRTTEDAFGSSPPGSPGKKGDQTRASALTGEGGKKKEGRGEPRKTWNAAPLPRRPSNLKEKKEGEMGRLPS